MTAIIIIIVATIYGWLAAWFAVRHQIEGWWRWSLLSFITGPLGLCYTVWSARSFLAVAPVSSKKPRKASKKTAKKLTDEPPPLSPLGDAAAEEAPPMMTPSVGDELPPMMAPMAPPVEDEPAPMAPPLNDEPAPALVPPVDEEPAPMLPPMVPLEEEAPPTIAPEHEEEAPPSLQPLEEDPLPPLASAETAEDPPPMLAPAGSGASEDPPVPEEKKKKGSRRHRKKEEKQDHASSALAAPAIVETPEPEPQAPTQGKEEKMPKQPRFGHVLVWCEICGKKTPHDKNGICVFCHHENHALRQAWGLEPAVRVAATMPAPFLGDEQTPIPPSSPDVETELPALQPIPTPLEDEGQEPPALQPVPEPMEEPPALQPMPEPIDEPPVLQPVPESAEEPPVLQPMPESAEEPPAPQPVPQSTEEPPALQLMPEPTDDPMPEPTYEEPPPGPTDLEEDEIGIVVELSDEAEAPIGEAELADAVDVIPEPVEEAPVFPILQPLDENIDQELPLPDEEEAPLLPELADEEPPPLIGEVLPLPELPEEGAPLLTEEEPPPLVGEEAPVLHELVGDEAPLLIPEEEPATTDEETPVLSELAEEASPAETVDDEPPPIPETPLRFDPIEEPPPFTFEASDPTPEPHGDLLVSDEVREATPTADTSDNEAELIEENDALPAADRFPNRPRFGTISTFCQYCKKTRKHNRDARCKVCKNYNNPLREAWLLPMIEQEPPEEETIEAEDAPLEAIEAALGREAPSEEITVDAQLPPELPEFAEEPAPALIVDEPEAELDEPELEPEPDVETEQDPLSTMREIYCVHCNEPSWADYYNDCVACGNPVEARR